MNASGRYSAESLRKILWDISGAFGDIGVLFPIAIALLAKNHFNPTALFLMTGLFYIIPAWYFRITMPVQPLKAMSAIALASGLSFEIINMAGIEIGLILLIIAFTGLSVKIGSLFPVSIVRGIQLGLGLLLIKTSYPLISSDISIAVIAFVILSASLFVIKKTPPLIPLMILGTILSFKGVTAVSLGPVAMTPKIPDAGLFWAAFTMLVLPQIGLTFGNAIVAAEATGKLLYGRQAERLTLKSIPVSMGLANVISGLIGGAPMCHGSGGLTAHNKFGASGSRSGYIIGFTLLILALAFGTSALAIVSAFPQGILGILLAYVGLQHSLFIRDILQDKTAVFIALAVAVSGFITTNLTLGVILGFGIHYSLIGLNKTIKHFQTGG